MVVSFRLDVRPKRPVRLTIQLLDYQGIVSPSQRVKVPVGPSGPSSASRTGSRAPSSTVPVPSQAFRLVLMKPGEQAFTLILVDSSSIAMLNVIAFMAVLDGE